MSTQDTESISNRIRMVQVEAGESAVVKNLRHKGRLPPETQGQDRKPEKPALVINLRDLDALEEVYHAHQPADSCVGLRKLFVGNFLKWQRELMREFVEAEKDADTRSELEWTFERFLQWVRRKQGREVNNVDQEN